MKKIITSFLLGAAMLAPLASTPAQAQTRSIDRLEQQVQEAKNRGDWGRAQDLEVQLNVERLAYQRAHGMGEVNDGAGVIRFNLGDRNRGYYRNYDRSYYNNNNQYYNNQYNRGYYDRWGNWHRY